MRRSWGLLLSVGLITVACGREPAGPNGSPEGPPLDWDNLLVNQVSIPGLQNAAPYLPFQPVVPEGFGAARVVLTDPAAVERKYLILGLIYDGPSYGRFWVLEHLPELDQQELEAMAAQCGDPQARCEGEWVMVSLRGGPQALMVAGPVAIGIEWLIGGIQFRVIGPSQTFTREAAIDVAEQVIAGTAK